MCVNIWFFRVCEINALRFFLQKCELRKISAFQKFISTFTMEIFADLFNATLAYNSFNSLFTDSIFTGFEVTSMLQSGLFMSFISLCHYWEVKYYTRVMRRKCNFVSVFSLSGTGMEHNSLQFHQFDVYTHVIVDITRTLSCDRSIPFICISTTVFSMGNLLHGIR